MDGGLKSRLGCARQGNGKFGANAPCALQKPASSRSVLRAVAASDAAVLTLSHCSLAPQPIHPYVPLLSIRIHTVFSLSNTRRQPRSRYCVYLWHVASADGCAARCCST